MGIAFILWQQLWQVSLCSRERKMIAALGTVAFLQLLGTPRMDAAVKMTRFVASWAGPSCSVPAVRNRLLSHAVHFPFRREGHLGVDAKREGQLLFYPKGHDDDSASFAIGSFG
jgi:hypothetical protein